MKNMIRAALCLVVVLALLCGCAPAQAPQQEEQPSQPVKTAAPQTQAQPQEDIPLPETAFFFSNSLENGFLYSQTLRGDTLTKITDEPVGTICQGNTVVFYSTWDGALMAHSLADGQSKVISAENVNYIKAHGDTLIYSLYDFDNGAGTGTDTLRLYNGATGEDTLLFDDVTIAAMELCGNVLYYTCYEMDNEQQPYALYRYDLTDGSHREIFRHWTWMNLFRVDEMMLVSAMEEEQSPDLDGSSYTDKWMIADPATGELTECPYLLETGDTPFYAEQGVIYTMNYGGDGGDDSGSELIRVTPTERKVVYSTGADCGIAYLYAENGQAALFRYVYTSAVTGAQADGYTELVRLDLNTGSMTELSLRGETAAVFENGDFPTLAVMMDHAILAEDMYDALIYNQRNEGEMPQSGVPMTLGNGIDALLTTREPEAGEEAFAIGCSSLVAMAGIDNPVTNITAEQFKQIYNGQITNWKELGGEDQTISVYYRGEYAPCAGTMTRLCYGGEEKDLSTMAGFIDLDENIGIYDMSLEHDPYGILYGNMGEFDFLKEDPHCIKGLSVDGVAYSAEAAISGAYPLTETLRLICAADSPAKEAVKKLADWFATSFGKTLLQNNNVTPLA